MPGLREDEQAENAGGLNARLLRIAQGELQIRAGRKQFIQLFLLFSLPKRGQAGEQKWFGGRAESEMYKS